MDRTSLFIETFFKPEVIVRYTPAMLKVLEADFARLPDLMGRGLESAAVAAPDPEPEPELPSAHLLFVPTPAKYLLVERQGPPPGAGDEIALSEGSFVVGKVGRSPVPGEPRSCAFLLARA